MKRQIIDKMEAWDESADRKPLILMGARQVGKTWLMEEFARRRYVGNTVVVNFMKSERLRLRFETTDLDPKSIIEAISIETGQKIVPGKTLLVLDGTTGQNAILQARSFAEVADITGLVITKLDGTAKGGIAVAVQSELEIPVKYIGVGEQIDDLQKFDPQAFVEALFDTK